MGQQSDSFLAVERSIGGRRWVSALDARGEARALKTAQMTGLPDIVARVLSARGVAHNGAQAFLDPRLRDLMPDPSTLTDMDAAAERLARAIVAKERIAIFGDYDVDGAASSALMVRYLRALGIEAPVHIPDRQVEGYGPNPDAMRALVENGARLIVTVDCGTGSFEAIEAARAVGADVLVLDHHQTGDALPDAIVVNPNRQDDLSGLGHLCAAGVVFMALVATSRTLRAHGFKRDALPAPFAGLDLVALATVCDVVPLTGLNRAFVVQGLRIMHALDNAGLAALSRAARLSGPVRPHHLGFLLGPRINAGGRIGDAALGARLLTCDDPVEAERIAERLDQLNGERQAMEKAMLAEAEAEVAAEIGSGDGPGVLIVGSQDWHPGIVGLLASRLKERYRRPAVAIAFDATGRGTASGRSVPGIDLGSLVREAHAAGIIAKGGGHAMAAGLTIARDRLGDLRTFLETAAGEASSRLRATDTLRLDGALGAGGLVVDLLHTIERAGPYGAGHAEPVFALPRHRVASAGVVGRGHVRAKLAAGDGRTVDAMAFNAAETDIGRRLLGGGGRPLHAAGTLMLDRFGGRESVRLRITDLAETID